MTKYANKLNKTRIPTRFVLAAATASIVFFIGAMYLLGARAAIVGDINNDGTVNVFDLSQLLSKWNTNDAAADLNDDNIVNVFDLSILLSKWGQVSSPTPTPPPPSPTITFNRCSNPTYVRQWVPTFANDGFFMSNYYIDQSSWNFGPYPGSDQSMHICDYNNWYAMVKVNDNANDGAVKSYPNVHKDYNNPRIDSFTTISSTYAHTAPSSGAWNYAYDVWMNNYAIELMIWTQSAGRQAHVPSVPRSATVTLSGITYNIHRSGGYIAYDMVTTRTSGTVNIKEIMNDAISRGYISGSTTLKSIQYGVETVDTGNVSTKFELNNFSITTQ